MISDQLQAVVDGLAERLKRSVAIDDPQIRLLAASRHFGDEDPVRIQSVMNRALSADVVEQILTSGVATATAPVRVVVDIEGSRARVCIPVRCDENLLGYLWLIDEDPATTEAEIELAAEAAAKAGVILFRRLVIHERSKARHEAILRELVASDAHARVRAVDDLRAEQIFGEGNICYQVVAVLRSDDDTGSIPPEVALEAAVEDGLRLTVEGTSIMVANRSNAWILLTQGKRSRPAKLDSFTGRIVRRFQELTHGQARLIIGVGAVVDGPEQVVDSYHQAFLAAESAELLPNIGRTVRWDELGPYKIFLQFPPEVLANAADVPALAELKRLDTGNIFLETLEVYLDNAGDARRTAEYLCVHRASLYYRLTRIEQITGCDLRNGYDRLTLHLGLKLGVLAAAVRPVPASAQVSPSRSRNLSV